MKITSSFINEINLSDKAVHTIIFKNTKHQMKFRYKLNQYFIRKQEVDKYVNLVDEYYKKKDARSFYFVNLNFSAVYAATEKSTDQLIKKVLTHHLNHNPELINLYQKVVHSIEEFLSNINLEYHDIDLEFEITDKVISNMLKAIKVHIDYQDEELVSNNEVRKLLISSLLDLNMTEKEVFILINYPEGEMAKDSYCDFINYLKRLNVTVVILTSAPEFINWMDNDKLFLINESGHKYDIIKLKQELLEFKYVNEKSSKLVANKLAYHDFMKDYMLLDPKYRYFLESSKI